MSVYVTIAKFVTNRHKNLLCNYKYVITWKIVTLNYLENS